jgi:hypothetical protein
MEALTKVATVVLERIGKILLLKRSKRVRTHKGRRGGVAGYVGPRERPFQIALHVLKN